jgi:predicted transcriptional regulator
MATVTVSTEIICRDCGKRMAKKNWKDHARHKHTMTEDTIRTKYEKLKPSLSFSLHDKPTQIV